MIYADADYNSDYLMLYQYFFLKYGFMQIQYNTIQIKFLRRRNFDAVQKESLTFGHRVGGAVIVARGYL